MTKLIVAFRNFVNAPKKWPFLNFCVTRVLNFAAGRGLDTFGLMIWRYAICCLHL